MNKASKISDAEFEVMKVIWDNAPVKSAKIIEILSSKTNWKQNTVLTLISRLVKKKVLSYKKEGKGYVYSPLVSKEECVKELGASFVNRFFDGSLMPMLAYFTGSGKLTDEEKSELMKMLEKGV